MKRTLIAGMLSVFVLAVAQQAMAVPTALELDPLIPGICDSPDIFPTHELGNLPVFGLFPSEAITSASVPDDFSPCPMDSAGNTIDNPAIANILVEIVNISGQPWEDLYFVAEAFTIFSNVDVFINGLDAFKIDNLGANRPLVFESMTADLIFEPFETWDFIVQDWINLLGGGPHVFTSIGVPSGFGVSSASIVANPIPEPATLLLFGVGMMGVGVGTRRRRKES